MSPLQIMKEDWRKEIESKEIQIEFVEKYFGAYDLTRAYNMKRISDYPSVLNSYILLLK